MAKLIANNAINLEALNFASFAGGQASNIVYNKNEITIDFTNGDRHQFRGSFGINILAQALSGTGTSWVFSNAGITDPFFSLTEAKIQATKAYKAGITATQADDLKVIADIFKGNDLLDGSQAADVLSGFKGNDTIVASGGDTVNGGDTKDKDVISFVEVTDGVQIILSKGVAKAFAVGGTVVGDNVVGGVQGSVVNVESVIGSSFGDTITGDGDANSLKGEGGDDLIDGGAGNDSIEGGAGMDTITGGAGKDVLSGGADADTFRYLSVADVAKGEILSDFVAGVDKLDLSAIDATRGSTPGSNEAFIFDAIMGTSKSAVAEGHISWYFVDKSGTANDRTFVRINVDTNTKIDMTIELKGIHNLTDADFIL